MSNLIPSNWKDSIEHLRSSVVGVFDHLLAPSGSKEPTRDTYFWPSTILANGGPAVDVIEEEDQIRVVAELPGVSEKDFTVELQGSRLLLRGEKKASREERREGAYFAECAYGSFSRTIPLPVEVDADKVSAEYKHGVLTVTLPKAERAKGKRIDITIR